MWLVGGKISHIPLAIDAPGIWSRNEAEEFLFWSKVDSKIINSVRLVTIAELTRNKGVGYGIQMMAELQKRSPEKYTYTIFGEGEDMVELQNLTKKLSDPLAVRFANVHMINYPSLNLSTEASRFLKAFHIYVLPSIKEGMPYVLLEAAAAGLPIVATEVVKSGASSLPNIKIVPSESATALANAVEEFTKNLEPLTSSIKSSFETMLKDTVALYLAP